MVGRVDSQPHLLVPIVEVDLLAVCPDHFSRAGDPTGSPDRPWTISTLGAASGVSRAALARRFTELVGEPPMTFLTNWRLTLAADLLREPDATVGSVARQVGYSTPFALSTAFKRVRGISPQQHRAGS